MDIERRFERQAKAAKRARRNLVLLSFLTVAIVVAYRLIVLSDLEQTSAMFIGLPALIAFCSLIMPPAKSATGTVMKSTFFLLGISGILLSEGLICILLAAPIFLGVALVVGLTVDRMSGKKKRLKCLVALPILLMSLEGTMPSWEFERHETVSVTLFASISQSEFFKRLSQPLNVEAPLPFFLRMGFPSPRSCRGEGLLPGCRREIHFEGGEGKAGDLVLEVVNSSASSITFICVEDKSHIAHWMNWKAIQFRWSKGQVSVVLDYERLLDPAWYFGPIERAGVTKAGEHLLRTFFDARDA